MTSPAIKRHFQEGAASTTPKKPSALQIGTPGFPLSAIIAAWRRSNSQPRSMTEREGFGRHASTAVDPRTAEDNRSVFSFPIRWIAVKSLSVRDSYLNADTYGIGELIAQRKRFRVPAHQRDYAWGEEQVTAYIDDILSALDTRAADYFVGLIVLIGPKAGVWEILDGQQRLATTTMMFSAIRQWLDSANFDTDANQIEQEFIGIRDLGKQPAARLTLNVNDRDVFADLVLNKTHIDQITEFQGTVPRFSSQRLLARAMEICRLAVADFAKRNKGEIREQVSEIYQLAQFLDHSVKVVCLELGSDSDAYMIFESLNFRGHDLSVLDLVKNLVYSRADTRDEPLVSEVWQTMRQNIAEKDADDFLKVVWTSQFERIQRGKLYSAIKLKCQTAAAAVDFVKLLCKFSDPYAALEDPTHNLWKTLSRKCSCYIDALVTLRSTQVRPVILSAVVMKFSATEMEAVLWAMVVLTVRHQTVGRRRTGVLEQLCVRLATGIASGELGSASAVIHAVNSSMPNDEEFYQDFVRYLEANPKRVRYILTALELNFTRGGKNYDPIALADLTSAAESTMVVRIAPKEPAGEWLEYLRVEPEYYPTLINRIGNWCLLETELCSNRVTESFANWKQCAVESKFTTTKDAAVNFGVWDTEAVSVRAETLARAAVATWTLR